MTTFNNFPNQVYAATLTGSNGITVTGSLSPYQIITRLDPSVFTVNNNDVAINGTASIKSINVSASAGYGFIEIGGPDGGCIDIKKPYGDDYDLRISSFGTPGEGGMIENYGGAQISLSGTNVGVGTTNPTAKLHIDGGAGINSGNDMFRLQGNDPWMSFYTGSDAPSVVRTAFIGHAASTGTTRFTIKNEKSNGDLNLLTSGSGNVGISATSGFSVTPTEMLHVFGNIKSTGNLVLDNGGVVFGIAAGGKGTNTSNTLSDYEEGTWTPTLGTSFVTSPVYGYRYGYYIKTGKLVQFWYLIKLDSGVSAGSTLEINGLPFTGGSEAYGSATIDFIHGFNETFASPITGLVFLSVNKARFYKRTIGSIFLTAADTSTDFTIIGAGAYYSST